MYEHVGSYTTTGTPLSGGGKEQFQRSHKSCRSICISVTLSFFSNRLSLSYTNLIQTLLQPVVGVARAVGQQHASHMSHAGIQAVVHHLIGSHAQTQVLQRPLQWLLIQPLQAQTNPPVHLHPHRQRVQGNFVTLLDEEVGVCIHGCNRVLLLGDFLSTASMSAPAP
jgi:hypothetical protein